uniref:Uncharacterized protein n=1 Tax=Pan troglodytes TaxID=9598 RepID=A0A2I3RJA1_PANTR
MAEPTGDFATPIGWRASPELTPTLGPLTDTAPPRDSWMFWAILPPPPPPLTSSLPATGSKPSSESQPPIEAQSLPGAPPPFDAQLLPGAQPPFDAQSPLDSQPQPSGQPWNFHASTSWYWRQSSDRFPRHQKSFNPSVKNSYYPRKYDEKFTDFIENRKKRKERNQFFTFFVIPVIVVLKIKKSMTNTSEHTKCPEVDCSFTAHEKTVHFHWRNMHAPGMKKIKLDTPEEIPTLANIERKKKLKLEKEKRGAVLTTTQYGKMKGMSRHSQMAKIRSPGENHKWKNDNSRQRAVTGSGNHLCDLKPEGPPEANADPLGVLINSDSESDKEEKPQHSVIPKEVTPALCSLMSSYGSLSGSESEPEETPIKTEADVLAENQVLDSSAPKSPSQDVKETVRNFSEAKSENRKKTPDIRHERNVILQCVPYIIKKDFFGLDTNSVKSKDV